MPFPVMCLILAFMAFVVIPVHGQSAEEPSSRANLFIAPLIEAIGYSRDTIAFGAGVAFGGGDGIALGTSILYAMDSRNFHTLEFAVFMRVYLQGSQASTGPFVQLIAGAAAFEYKRVVSFRSGIGALSAGLAAGWRFPFKDQWYVEPSVRAGYPYRIGIGVSAGYRL